MNLNNDKLLRRMHAVRQQLETKRYNTTNYKKFASYTDKISGIDIAFHLIDIEINQANSQPNIISRKYL